MCNTKSTCRFVHENVTNQNCGSYFLDQGKKNLAPDVSMKTKTKQVRKGRGVSKKCTNLSMTIMGKNCAGMKGKKEMSNNAPGN